MDSHPAGITTTRRAASALAFLLLAYPLGAQGAPVLAWPLFELRSIGTLMKSNGLLFFRACDSEYSTNHVSGLAANCELWKSDGTRAGTVLVKDINPGTEEPSVDSWTPLRSSSPVSLTDVNGTLFFFAMTDGSCGLWRSDGTEEGTAIVAGDVGNCEAPPHLLPDAYLKNVNGVLFFGSCNGIICGLWKSDGTTRGTVSLKTINVSANPFRAMRPPISRS